MFTLLASSGNVDQTTVHVLCHGNLNLEGTCCVIYTTCELPGLDITVATVAMSGSAEVICILSDSG